MRIAILSSHWFSIPCMQLLRGRGLLSGLGMPDVVHDGTMRLRTYAQHSNTSTVVLPKADIEISLRNWLSETAADVVFVFGFPYRLPSSVLGVPRFGFINVHLGLLPEYRGPDPIFWEIRDGCTSGAISVHAMEADFDSGPILHVEHVPILPDDNYGVHLMALAQVAPAVLELVVSRLVVSGETRIAAVPQDPARVRYRKRPNLRDIMLDWNTMPAMAIHRLVRACNPQSGGAFTTFRGQVLRVHQVAVGHTVATDLQLRPGQFLGIDLETGCSVASLDRREVLLQVVSTDAGIFSGSEFSRIYQPRRDEILRGLNY